MDLCVVIETHRRFSDKLHSSSHLKRTHYEEHFLALRSGFWRSGMVLYEDVGGSHCS